MKLKYFFIAYLLSFQLLADNSIMFSANNLMYNQEDNILTANNNVKLTYQDNLLLADKILYYNRLDKIKAIGNIKFLEAENNFIFADEASFSNSMKIASIKNVRIRFNDNSLLAANEANLANNIYGLKNAVYSPCSLCKGKNPQWQIRADNVELNKDKKNIVYKNAKLEVYGVPLLYTPYFSHPTNDVEAKSGLLTPKIGHISQLGNTVEIPLYLRIKSNKELVISPTFISKDNVLWQGKYNELVSKGSYSLGFSTIKSKVKQINNKSYRWHTHGLGKFQLSNNWQTDYNFKNVSDQTYLKNYKLSDEDHLTSYISLNYNKNHNYFEIKSMYFQNLIDMDINNKEKNSLLLPYSISHFESPKINNSNFYFDNNIAVLTRRNNYNFNRISNNIGYKKLFINNYGHIFEFDNSTRIDMYYTNDKKKYNNFTYLTPSLKLDWYYPLVKTLKSNKIYLKPRANFIITKKGFNIKRVGKNINNEDIVNLEISDDNLFNADKFAGFDIMEEGSRINYGFDTSVDDNNIGQIDLLFGQNYRFKKSTLFFDNNRKTNTFLSESGMLDQFSDYVGRINYKIHDKLKIFYRYRIDKDNFDFNKNEIGLTTNYLQFTFLVNFIELNNPFNYRNLESKRKQIFIQNNIALANELSISTYIRKNLSKTNKKIISTGGYINYNGDCVDIKLTIDKDFTHYKNQKKNSLSYFFTLSLKNITK